MDKSLGKSSGLTVRSPGRLSVLKPGEVRGTLGVGVISCNPQRTTSGDASDLNGFDGEGRSPGAQTGLDTPVVLGVNAAGLVSEILRGCSVPERSC